jgi:hypothetical protein
MGVSVRELCFVRVGGFQIGDDDLAHLVHRPPYPIRFLAIRVSHELQCTVVSSAFAFLNTDR